MSPLELTSSHFNRLLLRTSTWLVNPDFLVQTSYSRSFYSRLVDFLSKSDGALNADGSANRVFCETPSFWVVQPRVWFIQVEACFRFRKITCQSTAFPFVVTRSSRVIVSKVTDLIYAMPAESLMDSWNHQYWNKPHHLTKYGFNTCATNLLVQLGFRYWICKVYKLVSKVHGHFTSVSWVINCKIGLSNA